MSGDFFSSLTRVCTYLNFLTVYVRTQYVRLEWSVLVRSLVLTTTKRTRQCMWSCPNLKNRSLRPARLRSLVLTISNDASITWTALYFWRNDWCVLACVVFLCWLCCLNIWCDLPFFCLAVFSSHCSLSNFEKQASSAGRLLAGGRYRHTYTEAYV